MLGLHRCAKVRSYTRRLDELELGGRPFRMALFTFSCGHANRWNFSAHRLARR